MRGTGQSKYTVKNAKNAVFVSGYNLPICEKIVKFRTEICNIFLYFDPKVSEYPAEVPFSKDSHSKTNCPYINEILQRDLL